MTMIGIDPHKATHTAVAVDDNETVVDEFQLRASTVQADRLREWASGFDKREWAIESANGLGYLVAQQLVAAGETVFDVPPVLASRVRLMGSGRSQKNDPNDARSIAIAALRSDRLSVVVPDDHDRVARGSGPLTGCRSRSTPTPVKKPSSISVISTTGRNVGVGATPLFCFGMILCWSRQRIWWFTTSQDQHHTFEGMARFFDSCRRCPCCVPDRPYGRVGPFPRDTVRAASASGRVRCASRDSDHGVQGP